MEIRCPFCGRDPFEYVDVGVGMVPVAVNCCDGGIELYRHGGDPKIKRAAQLMEDPNPRRARHGKRLVRTLFNRLKFNGD